MASPPPASPGSLGTPTEPQTPGPSPLTDSSQPLVDPEIAALLRDSGRRWATVPAATTHIDPDLASSEQRGSRPGDRYHRHSRVRREGFEQLEPGVLQATLRVDEPTQGLSRKLLKLRRAVLGNPLANWQGAMERLTKVKALAVLSSDALSSVAYATEQILVVLVAAGAMAYGFTVPIMVAILALLAVVVLSYRQTIRAYPRGGGSYIVASDNLGPTAGLIAGCSLMTSYILTVSVSVASGVDAIVSALPPSQGYRVEMCVGFILLLVLGNLRGIRESGAIFAAPTYLFIAGTLVMVAVVYAKLATGGLHHASPQIAHVSQNLTIFLVLRAFASGATALTGVEAISDGVPAFQPPEWINARRTLTIMGVLLGVMFLGITTATIVLGIVAQDPAAHDYQTVLSHLAHAAFGDGVGYIYMTVATTAILVLAGNTAFSDFPRLFFFMSRDDYAPHLFKRLGDRLAYSNGIVVLGVASAALVIGFRANVSRLIPLYAVGVFTAFTMSQAGMVSRWLRLREPGWRRGLPINVLGVCTTGLVFIITGVAKFTQGAWIILVVVTLLVFASRAVHSHYTETTHLVSTETPTSPEDLRPVCLVPIADLNPLALQSLALARTFSPNVIALHVAETDADREELQRKWELWGNHVPLEVIESPYRSLIRPLLRYIDALEQTRRTDTIVVVLPEMVATRWWHTVLHNQSALRLKAALLFRPGTVVVNVPYHLRRFSKRRRSRSDRAASSGLDIEL